MTYRYMISYIDSYPGGFTNGSCELRRDVPIQSMEDVEQVRQNLRREYGFVNVIVMGFSQFDDGEDH